jgi:hypothetical protein
MGVLGECVYQNSQGIMQKLKVNIDTAVSITIEKTLNASLKPLSGGLVHVF